MLKTLFAFSLCLATIGRAATRPDFSGNFAVEQKKSNKAASASIRVVQTESAIEVTRIYGDKSVTNRFPLDGSEGDYMTETGARGRCRGLFKNDTLVLETLVASPPKANLPSLRFDTLEEWRLSTDAKTLTIKTEIKCPDMPPAVVAASFPKLKETYQRLDAR